MLNIQFQPRIRTSCASLAKQMCGNVCMQENACMWENVCMQGVICFWEDKRAAESKERSERVQSVQSIHNFLIKSDFCFRNHINWYKTLFPTNAWRSGTSNVLKGLIRVCENPRDDNLFSAIVHQCDTYCHDELLQFKSLKCTLNPYLWDLWITIVLVNLVEICNMGIAS